MLKTRLASGSIVLCLLPFVPVVSTTNYTSCLEQVRNGTFLDTYPNGGALDSHGDNVSDITKATALPYNLCIHKCGAEPEAFNWTIFSTNFSTWLLPWLALVSQLPFGSQLRHQNVMSVFLTVGSPALAAYSLIVCVLNWAWVPRAFDGIRYPNVEHAWRIMGSLQHSPLHVEQLNGMLARLIVLPENDAWWESLAKGLDYEETWTTAIVLQTAWVGIAFILTVVDSFQDGIINDFQSSGRGTGTLFLWLLPLGTHYTIAGQKLANANISPPVIGWQRLSPRCDYARVRDALRRANDDLSPPTTSVLEAGSSTRSSEPFPPRRRRRYPFDLANCNDDRGASAPIYSDSRLLPWMANVDLVAGVFRAAAEVMEENRRNPKDDAARLEYVSEVIERTTRHVRPLDWSTITQRCAIAGVLALLLHWGAIGSAIVYSFFTPTSGLGCRSGSFSLYALVGTIVWITIVASSFIAHYAEWLKYCHTTVPRHLISRYHLLPDTARMLARILRVLGKVLAVLNALFIVTACIFLFSNFYTRCWCDSSVAGRGAKHAFNTIAPTDADAAQLKIAWIGAIVLSLGSAAVFIIYVYMHVEPVPPDPDALQGDEVDAFPRTGYHLLRRESEADAERIELQNQVQIRFPDASADYDPYAYSRGLNSAGHSRGGTYSTLSSPSDSVFQQCS